MDTKVEHLFLVVLLLVGYILDFGFAAGEAGVGFIDTILAEIFSTGHTLYQLIRFHFRPT